MSNLVRWRVWRAKIARILPHAAIIAAVPLLAASFFVGELYSYPLSNLGLIAGCTGVFALLGRHGTRLFIEQTKDTADGQLMRLSAASAEAIRVYVEPDSQWRLNLIKEIADHINDDNATALAAIEGSVLDLGQRLTAMRAELDQLRRGN